MMFKSTPEISVVIPLYNKEQYIKRSMDSIMAQTFDDFEVIVINDGSTDDGPEIVKQFDDPRIRIINQENRGVSAARNRGIAEAKGELIAFLDADDEWLPGFLETVAGMARRFPNAGAYATGCRLLKDGKRIFRDLRIRSGHEEFGCYFDLLRKGMAVTSSSVAVRRSIFYKVAGFRIGVHRGEDTDLWFRIGLYYSYACSPKVCSMYHYYLPDNVSHTLTRDEPLPLYTSFLERIDGIDVKPLVRSKATRYIRKQLALEIRGIFLRGMRDFGRDRLQDYRTTFGLDRSYIRLLVLKAIPLPLLHAAAAIKMRLVSMFESVRAARSRE